jgi:hypothetical protein
VLNKPWDSHEDIRAHCMLARSADPAIATLVSDLKQRGLLDETLIIVSSEFGRTPMIQSAGQLKMNQGRDHNIFGFTMLLAGAGVRAGTTYVATDDFRSPRRGQSGSPARAACDRTASFSDSDNPPPGAARQQATTAFPAGCADCP